MAQENNIKRKLVIELEFIKILGYYAIFEGVTIVEYYDNVAETILPDKGCFYYFNMKNKTWKDSYDISLADVNDIGDIELKISDVNLYYELDEFIPDITNNKYFLEEYAKSLSRKIE